MSAPVVVFDAMGVLYTSGDDVAELLIPYLRGLGCAVETGEIERRYVECSLGRMTSDEFWAAMGVRSPGRDEEYCRLHRLTDGVWEALDTLRAAGIRLACLSNDVTAWSLRLRERFALVDRIDEWVISGAVGVRKPDPAIYRILLDRLGVAAPEVLFVDDRAKNLEPALALGLRAVHFTRDASFTPDGAVRAGSMGEVVELVRRWT